MALSEATPKSYNLRPGTVRTEFPSLATFEQSPIQVEEVFSVRGVLQHPGIGSEYPFSIDYSNQEPRFHIFPDDPINERQVETHKALLFAVGGCLGSQIDEGGNALAPRPSSKGDIISLVNRMFEVSRKDMGKRRVTVDHKSS